MTAPTTKAPGSAVAHAPAQNRVPMVTTEGGTSVTDLLHLAVENGTPVEALEKLVDLHERIAEREARMEFVRALASFKAKCPPIVHSRTANFATRGGQKVSYSYTELDELARIIDPVLTEHGFSYGWDERLDKGMVTTTCTLYHVSGHSRQSSFTLPADNDSAASPQQKIGMADTYASRRSLIAVLGLTTADKDPRPAEIDPTPINEDQVIALQDLLVEAGRTLPKFLSFLGVESLEQLPRVRFNEARSALDTIIAAKSQKAGK
ncbi:MAG TPA: ERF family protein [Gemmatimonadaceae bacterium]|nr:ERF family protein [Gemmatimonadaceae bacterium]